jgi:hypothetical protein
VLTRLRIANFKPWERTDLFRLAPITVYFGVNSSGKSSLNQLLLMLKQTVESADRNRVLHAGDETTPVDLGSFDDFVFRHETNREVRFALRWRPDQPIRIRDTKSSDSFSGETLGFSARVGVSDDHRHLTVGRMRYSVRRGEASQMTIGMEPDETKPRRYRLTAEEFRPVRNMGRKWELPTPEKFYGFPDEAVAYFQNTGFTADLTLSLEQVLRGISYLGPLRELPRRLYTWPGDTPQHVGWNGERTVDALLAARGREISPGPRRKRQSFHAVIARWLYDLKLIESFEIVPLRSGDQVSEVAVRTPGSTESVLLPDVGFGVSQVLPVIVQCFYAEPNTTIVVEQPELHLHPSAQSGLADLFIEAVQARENGSDRGIQVIVESHSEHFLRRLTRRIAEGRLRPDDVALYYCEPGSNGSRMHDLEVDPVGNIHYWPRGFFGSPMLDIARQAELALETEIANRRDEA